jgi:GNAT superfamily N-acetyltransferase
MAATDRTEVVQLDTRDAAGGLALSSEAHWNQNEADWRFFLAKAIVFGVRDGDRLVATAALLPYASGNAWISMVLVTADWRRRGIATRLVDRCLDTATSLGLTSWLDATPEGAKVYGPLGFAPTLQLRRLRLQRSTSGKTGIPPSPALGDLIARDAAAMGFDRGMLLGELGGRPGSRLMSNGGACALVREGRIARHIGPLFADGPDRALSLVHDIVRSETGPILIDAVASHEQFLKGLTDSGWVIERPFQRMRFGRAAKPSEFTPATLPFAVAGPEYG